MGCKDNDFGSRWGAATNFCSPRLFCRDGKVNLEYRPGTSCRLRSFKSPNEGAWDVEVGREGDDEDGLEAVYACQPGALPTCQLRFPSQKEVSRCKPIAPAPGIFPNSATQEPPLSRLNARAEEIGVLVGGYMSAELVTLE